MQYQKKEQHFTVGQVVNVNHVIEVLKAQQGQQGGPQPTTALSFHLANIRNYIQPVIAEVAKKEEPIHAYVDENGNVDTENEEAQKLMEERDALLAEEIEGFDPPKIPRKVIEQQTNFPLQYLEPLYPFIESDH